MLGYDYQNTNRENYIANTSGGTTDVVENSPPTYYSSMPIYNPLNPYSDIKPFPKVMDNPGAFQGDFRYEGVNPALNPNASPNDYKVFDRMGEGGPWNEFDTPNWLAAPYRVEQAGWFGDPTADGGWLDNLSRWWYGDDDPENDYLDLPPGLPPSDGFEPYDPTNPNHFMIPEGMEDMDIEDILEMMEGERFEADLGNYDLYHLMRNGYTLEEAQAILTEQGLA